MRKHFSFLLIILSLLATKEIQTDIIGSLTGVLKSGFFTFPQIPALFPNEIRGFAWMANGFSLANSSTNCIFNGIFPVSGNVNLNGGTFTLENHLKFADTADLQTVGTIVGSGFIMDLGESISTISGANNGIFQNLTVLFNTPLTIDTQITFQGTCAMIGNDKTLTLGDSGILIIDSGAELTLRNIHIKGVRGVNIRCASDSSILVLDNVIWEQDEDYLFTTGALQLNNTVKMESDFLFAYQSAQTSTLYAGAQLKLDKSFTFSYDPVYANSKDLIEFIDDSSQLILKSASLHTTVTGMNVQKGQIIVKGNSTVSSETGSYLDATGASIPLDEGIVLGDNANASNDGLLEIEGDAILTLSQGSLHYKNINSASWNMMTDRSKLVVATGAALKLFQNLTENGLIEFEDKAILGRADGKKINGAIRTNGKLLYSRLL